MATLRLPNGSVPVSTAGLAPESPQPSLSLSGTAVAGVLPSAGPAEFAASGVDLAAITDVLQQPSRRRIPQR